MSRNIQKIIIFMMLGFVFLVFFENFLGRFLNKYLIINITSSLPVGFYLKHENKDPKKGDIVVICPVQNEVFMLAINRKYINLSDDKNSNCWSERLMKVVVAVEGDFVQAGSNGVFVNDKFQQNSQPQQIDSFNREMPKLELERHLQQGELFLLTPNKKSFDSRYFGMVKKENVVTKVSPFLTWGINDD